MSNKLQDKKYLGFHLTHPRKLHFVNNITKPHNEYASNNKAWKTYDIRQHVRGMIL